MVTTSSCPSERSSGKWDDAKAVFDEVLPVFESNGWHRLQAFRPVIGDVSQLVLLFRLDSVAAASAVRDLTRTSPQIREAVTRLNSLVRDETLVLYEDVD